MNTSDIEKLLEPLSPESPCGPDLEYDAAFGEMERAARGKSEQQFGSTIVSSEPPDWKAVRSIVQSLLERTKDMRVAVYLARSSLNLEGLTGFQLALQLLRGYIETYWDSLHPALDHSDDDDPTYRTNTLVALGDEETIVLELRGIPIISSRALGQFNLRDIELARLARDAPPTDASGGWGTKASDTSAEVSLPSLATIEAACLDVPIEALKATDEAARLAAEHVSAIERFVTEQVGATRAVSLETLRRSLVDIKTFVQSQLERRGVFAGRSAEALGEANGGGADSGLPEGVALQPQSIGRVTTREEAIKALDSVCEFYERNEPSSPLPLLIRRAKRLASKSFLEILRDLAPDAVGQAEALGGAADNPPPAAAETSSW
jgi:type VI secretion system protein ImpA